MYTLILLFSLSAGAFAGGVTVNSQQIFGFESKAACISAGKKAMNDLGSDSQTGDHAVIVTTTCLKVK